MEYQEFKLYTDNSNLSCLLNHPQQVGKLARWIEWITLLSSPWNIKGAKNIVADSLSRLFDRIHGDSIYKSPPPHTDQSNSLILIFNSDCLLVHPCPSEGRPRSFQYSQLTTALSSNYWISDGTPLNLVTGQVSGRVVLPPKLFDMVFNITTSCQFQPTWVLAKP